jgi:hypothetical protein
LFNVKYEILNKCPLHQVYKQYVSLTRSFHPELINIKKLYLIVNVPILY